MCYKFAQENKKTKKECRNFFCTFLSFKTVLNSTSPSVLFFHSDKFLLHFFGKFVIIRTEDRKNGCAKAVAFQILTWLGDQNELSDF